MTLAVVDGVDNELDLLLAGGSVGVLADYCYADYLAEWVNLFGHKGSGKRWFSPTCDVLIPITVSFLGVYEFDSMRRTLAVTENDLDAMVLELYLLF